MMYSETEVKSVLIDLNSKNSKKEMQEFLDVIASGFDILSSTYADGHILFIIRKIKSGI